VLLTQWSDRFCGLTPPWLAAGSTSQSWCLSLLEMTSDSPHACPEQSSFKIPIHEVPRKSIIGFVSNAAGGFFQSYAGLDTLGTFAGLGGRMAGWWWWRSSFQISPELLPRRRLEGAVLQGMGVLLRPRSASLQRQVKYYGKCCL